jgi:hypothetical protein
MLTSSVGVEAGGDLGLLLLGEVFRAVAEDAADLVERVVFVPASAQSVLLDAAADFVQDLGAEPELRERRQAGRSRRAAHPERRPFVMSRPTFDDISHCICDLHHILAPPKRQASCLALGGH